MTPPNKNVLYTGVTSELATRIWKHKTKFYPTSFSTKYNCILLVYYRYFETIEAVIAEEKRIKSGSRKQKEDLIISINPSWRDLYDEVNI